MIRPRNVSSMRSLLARSLSLAALFVAACAPPPPPARHASIVLAPPPLPPIAPATPAPDPTVVSVAVTRWPLHFTLDGDLAEWGSLLPPIPPPPASAAKEPVGDVPDEPPPPPNLRDAASHLAIAVSGEGALIAADLSGSARAGIWLGLGAGASSVPPIGIWQRDGGIADLTCEATTSTGEVNPPEAIAACQQPAPRRDRFVRSRLSEATHVAPSEATLYTKKATLGDVEVGLVSADNDWIAILKKGKLVDLVDLSGDLKGIVERDGEIHVLAHWQYTNEAYSENASWTAFAVTADGSTRESLIQQEEGSRPWNQVSELHSKTLDSFGLRGWSSYGGHGDEGIGLSWRWDKAKRSYVRTQRKIPLHKTTPKKP